MGNLPRISLPKKPVYRHFATDIDFYQLFTRIQKRYSNCFLFESLGEQGYDARHSVIGFEPDMIFEGRGGSLVIDGVAHQVENPYYAMREIIPTDIISRKYAGGLVGYLGYDAANYFEPALDISGHPDFPPFMFGLYTDGLIYDSMTGEVFYFYYKNDRSALIEELLNQNIELEPLSVKNLGASKTREQHHQMVEQTLEEVRSGNTFQCQIGFETRYQLEGDPIHIYAKLREINPSPHMFYLKFGEIRHIGASPELLFRLRQGEMETFPLAGTAARGKNPDDDRGLARRLLNDPKEIAEHNMLVDLHRNDLGRVARFGSVKVRSLMDIKRFSHVQHISSEIVGLIDPEEDMFSALAMNFPAGTLSGAPKIESMKIIEKIENEPRGPYGGSVGHFGFNGDSFHVIPIRTLFVSGNRAFSRASGGVVYDSTADNEYQEIQNKSAAVFRALEGFLEK